MSRLASIPARARVPAALALGALLAACSPSRLDRPVATQRPTLSSDTATAPPGTLELETGVGVEPDGTRLTTPTELKLGAGERTELFAFVSPYNELETDAGERSGASDVAFGLRHRFWEDETGARSAGVQLANSFPVGSDELSSGEVDFFAAGMVTQRLGSTALTAFYELGVLGERADDAGDGTGTRPVHGLALAAAQQIDDRIGAYGELATVLDPDGPDRFFTTWGASYAHAASFVLDVGFRAGLNSDTPDLVLLAGLTWGIGRVFGAS